MLPPRKHGLRNPHMQWSHSYELSGNPFQQHVQAHRFRQVNIGTCC